MRKPHVLSLSVQNLAHFPQLPSRGKIQRWISRALENDAQITVRFVEEEEGRELNKTYRGKDYATNVLFWSLDSFSSTGTQITRSASTTGST